MPIIPVYSESEFLNLFPLTTYDYLIVLLYSPSTEKKFFDKAPRQLIKFNKCHAYFDRLSNSDKYSHVLWIEINTDKVVEFCLGASPFQVFEIYSKNAERLTNSRYDNTKDIRRTIEGNTIGYPISLFKKK